ncbi:MAG: VCBS repeat-containing protein [Planctomycetota bacterium]|nr:VCBS repeat-containing protein [Planctomycetota bacterium]
MNHQHLLHALACCLLFGLCSGLERNSLSQERIGYQHDGLIVDLGVGLWAWPLPLDWDGDGDLDLLVSCPDVPYNGTYFFENRSGPKVKMPIFEPPVRVGPGLRSPQVSRDEQGAHVLTAGVEWVEFRKNGFQKSRKIYPRSNVHPAKRIRANQWKYCDFDADGRRDLLVGVGDWTDYGWDNSFDPGGNWTRGPLRGPVYLIRNRGTNSEPDYEDPARLTAGGVPIDQFGMPSPCLDDFDGDGDQDLICGEFVDGFTYYENRGSRNSPQFAAGKKLVSGGSPLKMDLQMITPVSIDWDGDGDGDLICGDEDGRVAFIENRGVEKGMPRFEKPRYFQQRAADLKFGALVTPVSFDWDGDGDSDLICGNTAGYIGFIENLGLEARSGRPIWNRVRYLEAGGKVIRIMAGKNGSIQGPAESKWGYTTLSVADWDHDGKADLVVNSIWGKVVWYRNVGPQGKPALEAGRPLEVQWEARPQKPEWNWWNPRGKELATQWRTTPLVVDLNQDGLNDLVMLDHEGYLAFFPRKRLADRLLLGSPERIFETEEGKPLRLNSKYAGGSGRRKLCLVDWDQDGKLDLLVNSKNVDFFRNVSRDSSQWRFRNMGAVSEKKLAGHTTSPTTVDWNGDQVPDLLVGAEDGFFYYMENSQAPKRNRSK